MSCSLPRNRGFQPNEHQPYQNSNEASETSEWPEISRVFKHPINPSSRLQHHLISCPRKFKRRIQGDISRYTTTTAIIQDGCMKYRQPSLHSSYRWSGPPDSLWCISPAPYALSGLCCTHGFASAKQPTPLGARAMSGWLTLKTDQGIAQWTSEGCHRFFWAAAACPDSTNPQEFLGWDWRLGLQPFKRNQQSSTDFLNLWAACNQSSLRARLFSLAFLSGELRNGTKKGLGLQNH